MIRSIAISLLVGAAVGLAFWVLGVAVILLAQVMPPKYPALVALSIALGMFWADLVSARRQQ